MIESNPLSESDEEATSMDLSIPFSSEEAPTSPEVAEVDPHSPEEMSDSSEAQGTGDQARHYPQRTPSTARKISSQLDLKHWIIRCLHFLFCFFLFKGKGMWYL